MVSERVPTMDMLKETHELIEHVNYYRAIKGLINKLSLIVLQRAFCNGVFRSVCQLQGS